MNRNLIGAFFTVFSMTVGSTTASAESYPKTDAKSCFVKPADADLSCVQTVLDQLDKVARSYPPKPLSVDDKARASNDVQALHDGLLAARGGSGSTKQGFFALALVNNFGFNLGVPGAGGRAYNLYKAFVENYPDDAEARVRYGAMLAGMNTVQAEALPHLEKAIELGRKEARYTIALVHVSLGKNEAAVSELETHLKSFPDDKNARSLLDGLKSGKVSVIHAPSAK